MDDTWGVIRFVAEVRNIGFCVEGLTVQGFVDVAESVGEVDPRIHNRQGDEILENRDAEEDEEFSQRQLDGVQTSVLRSLLAGQVIPS